MCEGVIFETHPLTEYVDYLYPIDLTEEWLLKFGATRFGGDLGWNCNNHLICWAECRQVFIHSSTSVELKYVHQWQNLYFVLTREELTLTQKSGT